jgi:hypothetical protein
VQASKHGGATALLVSGVLLAAACSGSTEEPAGLATSDPPPATTSPPEEPDPTPTPETESENDGDPFDVDLPSGLVFEDLPDLAEDEIPPFRAFMTYYAEEWRMLTTNEPSDVLQSVASPDMETALHDRIASQDESGFTLGGTLRYIGPEIIGLSEDAAVIEVCFDQSGVEAVWYDEPGSGDTGDPQRIATLDLNHIDGRWQVVGETTEAGTC